MSDFDNSDDPTGPPLWGCEATVPEGGVVTPALLDPEELPQVLGPYELRSVLGRGGMGVVYRAVDLDLGREVAVKRVWPELLAHEGSRRRFLSEARALAALHHPSLVDVYAFGTDGPVPFLVMRLVEGESLQRRLGQGPFATRSALRLVRQLAGALKQVHNVGLLHRDVKPGNILLEPQSRRRPRPVLIDFGLVRSIADGRDVDGDGDAPVGTPAYMAPEQFAARGAVGPASDPYSLGVVLYEMLSGVHPFGSTDADRGSLARRLTGPPPLPPGAGSRAARRICGRMMAPRPSDRYPGMTALVADLDRALSGRRVENGPTSWARQLRWGARRHPAAVAAGTLLAVGLVGGTTWAVASNRGVRAMASALHSDARETAARERALALLARGDRAGAAQALEGWAERVRDLDPAQVAALWRWWGAELRGAGHPGEARDALHRSFGLVDAPTTRLDLAQVNWALQDWRGVELALAGLDPTALPERRRADHAAVSHALALSRRDVAVAPPGDLIAALLSEATPLGVAAQQAVVVSGPQPTAALLVGVDRRTGWRLSGGPNGATLGPAVPLSDVPVSRVQAWPAGEDERWVIAAGGARVLGTIDHDRVVAHERWAGEWNQPLAAGDLDGDGVIEVVRSDHRALAWAPVDATGLPVAWTPVQGTLTAGDSELLDLAVGPYGLAGSPALLVAVAGWGGYDVRVLQRQGADWRTVERLQLGEVLALAPVPGADPAAVQVLQAHDPTAFLDTRTFGPSVPHGAARGVHRVAVAEGRLAWQRVSALPADPVGVRGRPGLGDGNRREHLVLGDLDGDGVSETIVGQATQVMHVWTHEGGPPTTVEGLWPLAALNLDDDPADELVVADLAGGGAVWVLGMGADRVPALEARDLAVGPAPTGLSDDAAERWRRADALDAIGAWAEAAREFERLARREIGTPTATRAWNQVASVRADHGDPLGAITALDEAAQAPDAAPAALNAAIQIALDAGRFDVALDRAARRASLGPLPPPLAADVARWTPATDAPAQVWTFNGTVPAPWSLPDPAAPSWDSRQEALVLRLAGTGSALSLPLWTRAPQFTVEIELEALRLDWGSGAALVLEGAAGPPLVLAEWMGVGGGGRASGAVGFGPLTEWARYTAPVGEAVLSKRHKVRVAVDATRSVVFATLVIDGVEVAHTQVALAPGALPERPVALSLTSAPTRAGAVAELSVRSIRVTGLVPPDRASAHRLDLPTRALLAGDRAAAHRAAAVLSDEDHALVEILASQGVGVPEAHASLPSLSSPTARALLLRHPSVVAAASQQDGAGAALAHLHESWEKVLHASNPPTSSDPMLLEHAVDALSVAPGSLDTQASIRPLVCLLTDRAAALRRSARVAEAVAHVAAARSWVEVLSGDLGLNPAMAEAASRVELEQARLDLLQARPDAAIVALQRAVGRAPDPETVADRLVADPAFAALQGHPGWAEIARARRLAGTGAP